MGENTIKLENAFEEAYKVAGITRQQAVVFLVTFHKKAEEE